MIPRELATAIEALERVLPGVAVADLPALFGEIERLRVTAWQRMTVPQLIRATGLSQGRPSLNAEGCTATT